MSYELKNIKVMGYTTDFNQCECCGKTDLNGTVSILDLNSDAILHFGTTVEHIRRQGFEIPKLIYFRILNQRTKAESLHFCPAFVYALLAVVLFVKQN